MCREFARNNQSGSKVNFSATTGIVSARPDLYNGGHKHPAYSISKAGVINLTKFLATHFAPKIRVNCIAPGGVEFDQDEKFKIAYSSLTPMKRMMRKNELNKLVEFLCSSDSSYMTGSTVVVDGGWTTWWNLKKWLLLKQKIRIGIIGCSSIAKSSTIPAILKSTNCKLSFIGSRNDDKAKKNA